MTPYGLRTHPKFDVFRLMYPPGLQYESFITQAVYIYQLSTSGSIRFDEGTSEPSLVNTTSTPGLIYDCRPTLYGSTIKFTVLESNSEIITITPKANRGLLHAAGFNVPGIDDFINAEVIAVDGQYTLPANTYSVVAEGTLTFLSNGVSTIANSEVDTYIVDAKSNSIEVTGQGKMLIFNLASDAST